MTPLPPERVGRYEVRRRLGEGGFGEVLLAHDPTLRRDVAVKLPRGDWWADEGVLEEARALARLDHPNIVRVLDAGHDGRRAFIVLEYVDGRDLSTVVESTRGRRPWAVDEVVRLLAGPAAGLDHAHEQGVLHRDLKPANLLAPPGVGPGRPAPEPRAVKVTDFGLAAIVAARGPTAATPAVGDPRYVAPEAWRGTPDRSSDVFGLAAIAFHLLTGSAPVAGEGPLDWLAAAGRPERQRVKDLAPDLPRGVDRVLAAALSPRRHERPRSAGLLLRQLEDAARRDTEREQFVADARRRIRARSKPLVPSTCPACRRPVSPRAKACLHCGEPVA